MTEDMLSIEDAAQLLDVGRDYSVDLLDAGKLALALSVHHRDSLLEN